MPNSARSLAHRKSGSNKIELAIIAVLEGIAETKAIFRDSGYFCNLEYLALGTGYKSHDVQLALERLVAKGEIIRFDDRKYNRLYGAKRLDSLSKSPHDTEIEVLKAKLQREEMEQMKTRSVWLTQLRERNKRSSNFHPIT